LVRGAPGDPNEIDHRHTKVTSRSNNVDYEEQRGSDAEPGMPESESAAEGSTEELASEALTADENVSIPTPPEWPAADLTAGRDDEPEDLGDDSDAPVQLDDEKTQLEAPAETAPATASGLLQAENVNLSQGGVQSVEASTVTLSQGGAGQVRAETMSVEQGGVGMARVSTLTLGSGASAFAVVADKATVEEGSNAFLVISRSFSGDTKPTIDWRGAMAFGAGLGLVISILRRIR
jgi:hypothetical protein